MKLQNYFIYNKNTDWTLLGKYKVLQLHCCEFTNDVFIIVKSNYIF